MTTRDFLLKLLWLAPLGSCLGEPAAEAEFPNPSSFRIEHISRNPFHPIPALSGENKAKASNAPVVPSSGSNPALKISPDAFKVTSISMNQPGAAIINGRSYITGETFTAELGKQGSIRVIVSKIDEQGVVLELGGAKLRVPLYRGKSETGETQP